MRAGLLVLAVLTVLVAGAYSEPGPIEQGKLELGNQVRFYELLCTSDNVTSFLHAKIVTLSNCHINQHY